jgi:hypothetical protein
VSSLAIKHPNGHGNDGSLTLINDRVAAGSHYVSCVSRHEAEADSQVECTLLGKEGETTPPFKILGV